MLPAHQHLETRDGTICEANDRLIVQSDLTAHQSTAKVRFQLQAVGCFATVRYMERHETVAAVTLALERCEFGVVQQIDR